MNNNIIPHTFSVSKEKRNKIYGHKSLVIWFTGLSGSGKSTLANLVEEKLFQQQIHTFSIDGDNIRSGINKDLSFTAEDRFENLRRIAEVSNLFVEAGIVVIASFISPLKKDREMIKRTVGESNFFEVFVNTSIEECERRDIKGLYKKARKGEIANFTGISAPYETPDNSDIEIKTEEETMEESVEKIVFQLQKKLKYNG